MTSRIFLASSIADCGKELVRREGLKGKTCLFITTAGEAESGDKQWQENDKQGLVDGGLKVDDYTITGKSRAEVREKLMQYDVVHVNGGNSYFLLQQMNKCEFKAVITDFLDQGRIYIGSSAGSIVAGPDIEPARKIEDPEKAPELKSTRGLTLTKVNILPHWGNNMFRERYLKQRLEHAYTTDYQIVLLNDFQYARVFEGNKIEIVDIRETHKDYPLHPPSQKASEG